MKKYLYLIKNAKIPTYLKYWLMYSSKKISLLIQSLPITLENTIKNLKIIINKIYGNTEQATALGTNYFNALAIPSSTEIVINDEGKNIKMPIATVGNGYVDTLKKLSFLCPNLKVGDVVYLYFTKSPSAWNNLIYLQAPNYELSWSQGTSKTITQQMLDSNVIMYGNRANEGQTEQVTITDFRIVKNTTDVWESYGASPSPDYPSPVNNITGDVEVKVQNKNVWDEQWELGYYGLNGKVTGSDNIRCKNYIQVKPSTTYYMSLGEYNAYIYFYNSNKVRIPMSTEDIFDRIIKTGAGTITTPSNAKYMTFYLGSSYGTTYKNDIAIIKGSSGTYAPHQEQNYPISLGSLELCKIGDYQDYIYKENGNWYKYGAVGKVVLDGSESWNNYRTDTSNFALGFSTSIKDSAIANIGLSNYFVHNDGAVYEASNNGFWITGGNRIYIGIDKTLLADISSDTAKKASFISWLSTHNTEVYYALATPTNTQITDTTLINQLNALEQAYSYEDVTNISSNQNIYLDIDYIKRG